jgi:hypothetical protein
VYENAIERPGGYEWEYAGYTFKKHDTVGTNHSEVNLYNEQGKSVECYTISAFDSFLDFAEKVEALMDYGPDSMTDWLNRNRE